MVLFTKIASLKKQISINAKSFHFINNYMHINFFKYENISIK